MYFIIKKSYEAIIKLDCDYCEINFIFNINVDGSFAKITVIKANGLMSSYLAQISIPYTADEIILKFIINLNFIANQEECSALK